MGLTKISTDGVKDDAITSSKIPANAIGASELAVSTDLVADTSPQLGGSLDVNNKNVNFGDSTGTGVNRLRMGASNDLQIWHDGNASYIVDSGTGDLQIQGTQLKLQDDNGNDYLRAFTGGSVYLHHSGNSKFETTSYGALVTGTLSAGSGNFDVSDNGKFKAGNSSDLQIYHDGTNSHITNSTGYVLVNSTGGDLALRSNANVYLQPASGENSVVGLANGSTSLYHDNNKRLETSSGGIDISGATDGVVNINTTDSRGSFIRFQENGTSRCWVGSGQGISLGTKNDLGLRATNHIRMRSGSEEHVVITDNGYLAAKGEAGNWIYSQDPTNSSSRFHQLSSSRNGDWMLQLRQEHHAGLGFVMRVNSTSNSEAIAVYRENSSNYGFKVYQTGNVQNINNSYGSLSDVSLKENIVDAKSQWNDIKAVKVRNFNLKSDDNKVKMLGVVAQELETVSPKLVFEDKEGVKGVHYSVLYMKAIKALQEAMAKIEVLETKVTALEAA